MKNSTIIWIIALVIILGGLGWYVASQSNMTTPSGQQQRGDNGQPADQEPTTNTNTGVDEDNGIGDASSASVILTGGEFSPATVTVKKGGTVTWSNQGSGTMWIAADDHPTHTQYAGTTRMAHCPDTAGAAFDQCTTGNNYSFTFEKVGAWEYHNHMNAGQTGTVTVVE